MSAVESARRVAIVMAMEAEAAPLRAALGAVDLDPPAWAASLPVRLSSAPATDDRPEIVLAVNGEDPITGVACIGTTAAALTTQVVLNLADGPPDLLLTVGTCGGWTRAGADIGTTYLAWPHFACHDRRIDLPGFQAFGDGNLAAADLRSHADALGCELGIVTTGDSLDESPTDRERIIDNGGVAKEMEAAAVAWVAHLHGVPIGGVKSVTDLVDSEVDTPEQFQENLAAASEALQRTTLALLTRLATTD
ncbi:MAG: 5'-methylthioadenosine nucleosidase [Actinomycetota bacterium]